MRVLLLNPPSHPPVLRDLCCGETSKASYYWAPIDLLVLSGTLSQHHDVRVLDATAERLPREVALRRAEAHAPGWVFSLVAAVSVSEDMGFLRDLADRTGCSLAVLGDIAFFHTSQVLSSHPFLTAVVTDFTRSGALRLVEGQPGPYEGVTTREGSPGAPGEPTVSHERFRYPVPRHDLFPCRRYSMPYSRHRRVATIMYGYGCPFRCSFCSSWRLGYRRRELDNFLGELRYLSDEGFREFFLRDLTFGIDEEDASRFCEAIEALNTGMVWSCEARVDTLSGDLLERMSRAGCHLVMIGVETAAEEALHRSGKNISTGQARRVFAQAREAGISTLGHFILGLPGETRESALRTIDLAIDLGCDYASFNLLVPRLGSDVRSSMVESGSIRESDLTNLDCSRDASSASSLSPAQLKSLRSLAMRRFYGRPGHILRLLSGLRSPGHLAVLLRNGLSVIGESLRRSPPPREG